MTSFELLIKGKILITIEFLCWAAMLMMLQPIKIKVERSIGVGGGRE